MVKALGLEFAGFEFTVNLRPSVMETASSDLCKSAQKC